MPERQVILAAVAGAHGVGGEVRLKLFSDGLESLQRHQRLFAGDRPLTLIAVRPGRDGAIARFDELKDRNAAEALRGQLLSIPRSELPPLEQEEYYHADLIALRCESADGEWLGTVVAVENFGAGDLLEVEREGGRRVLVPYREGVADLVDGRILLDPIWLD